MKYLSKSAKDILFAVIVRNRTMFKTAKASLASEHFPERDASYEMIWLSVTKHYELASDPPSQANIKRIIDSFLEEDEDDDDIEETIRAAKKVVKLAFLLTQDEIESHIQTARTYLKRYLNASLLQQATQLIESEEVPDDLSTLLSDLHHKTVANTAVEMGETALTLPMDYFTGCDVFQIPTSIPFFDAALDGGPESGEVIGWLGCVGSGKSTFTGQMADSRAKTIHAAKSEKICYIFSFEEAGNVRMALASCCAGIPRDTIKAAMRARSMSQLSSSQKGDLKEYERAQRAMLKKSDRKYFLGELERWEMATKIVNKHICLADFSGANQSLANFGPRYVDGIVDFIQIHQDQQGNPGVDLVFVDYATACVSQHLHANPKLVNQRRELILRLPFHLKRMISNKFRTATILLHQLDTAANARGPARAVYINEAGEAKTFDENCDFAMACSKMNDDGYAVVTFGKARRTTAAPDQIIRLDKPYSRFVAADRNKVSLVEGRVVDAGTARMLGGFSASKFGVTD